MVNEAGVRSWVKFRFHSEQGVVNLTNEEAAQAAVTDPDTHRRDLFDAIRTGDHPRWVLKVQVLPYEDAKTYRINPFDLTKVWPRADYPEIEVGRMTLNRNPENHFAQIEQAAFDVSALVPAIGFSPDKVLLGRALSYADTHRHRIGANYLQLPVNRPHVEVSSYQFDGPLRVDVDPGQPTYYPNSVGGPEVKDDQFSATGWEVDGELVRQAYTLRPDDDDFSQANALVSQVFDQAGRDRLAETVASTLGTVRPDLKERVLEYWRNVDQALGDHIAELAADPTLEAHGPAPAGGDPDDAVNKEVDVDKTTPLNDGPLPAGKSGI